MLVLYIALIFAVVAFLYSSAGFGGGSSYLAILTLFGVAFIETRFVSLSCNILVVAGSSALFMRSKMLNWRKIIPLVVLSIPMAYLGGRIRIAEDTFYIILGLTLITAGPAMLVQTKIRDGNEVYSNTLVNAFIGGGIGLLSGLVGIGGGIFLAPILHLLHWDDPKRIAATASFFILVNSIAGMFGQLNNASFMVDPTLLIACMAAVFIGGQAGVRISIRNLSPHHLRQITAVLVVFVGIKILFEALS